MALRVVKQENYNKEKDTILGISRVEYLKELENKVKILLASNDVEKAYTDLPVDVQDWFDADGIIKIKLKEGLTCEDFTLDEDVNEMMGEVSNEDGMFVIVKDSDAWERSFYTFPEEQAYENYRRLK